VSAAAIAAAIAAAVAAAAASSRTSPPAADSLGGQPSPSLSLVPPRLPPY